MPDMMLYTGPMFSSKTTKLLMQADKRQYQKQNILAFKSRMDDRYSKLGEIVTHNFNKLPAILVRDGNEIIRNVLESDGADCIIVDELFLIDGGASACIELFKKGYDIVIASIDLSFAGQPFDEVKEIMPFCTRIIKCKAVCPVCQKDALYTFRKGDNTNEILVGGKDIYEPRCQLHHPHMHS